MTSESLIDVLLHSLYMDLREGWSLQCLCVFMTTVIPGLEAVYKPAMVESRALVCKLDTNLQVCLHNQPHIPLSLYVFVLQNRSQTSSAWGKKDRTWRRLSRRACP